MKKRVLIIDDDMDMCTLLSRFLTRNGYETDVAYSGQKGLAKFEEENFDAVLCDFRLGNMDGKEVMLAIKKIKPEQGRFNTITQQEQEFIIQKKIAKAALQLLDEKFDGERQQNEHVKNLFARLQLDLNFFQQDVNELVNLPDNKLNQFQRIYLEILESQREMLTAMNQRDEYDEDLIRKYLSLIDMEEFKVREKRVQN